LSSDVTFIGGHPMAGSEHTGVEYAQADLFDRATYALMIEQTAASGPDETSFKRLKKLIDQIGARVVLTDPESHDAAVGLISHLPQLVASSLATLLGPEYDGKAADRALAQQLAATGW